MAGRLRGRRYEPRVLLGREPDSEFATEKSNQESSEKAKTNRCWGVHHSPACLNRRELQPWQVNERQI